MYEIVYSRHPARTLSETETNCRAGGTSWSEAIVARVRAGAGARSAARRIRVGITRIDAVARSELERGTVLWMMRCLPRLTVFRCVFIALWPASFGACAGEIGGHGIDASQDGARDGFGDRADATVWRDAAPTCTMATRWACAADHSSRARCNGSVLESEPCAPGCVDGNATTDALCAEPCGGTPTALPTWTCSVDGTRRGRCVNGRAEVQPCSMGCHPAGAGQDSFCGEACAGSASGTSAIWTCTSDRTSRQRCPAGVIETERCASGSCVSQPSGVDDVCPPDPNASNAAMYCVGGQCVHWWNCRVTYQYQYSGSRDWDTDFHMADGTPIALPHRSRLTAIFLVGSGFQPEFTDLTSGEWVHFNHLHLNSEFGGNDRALGHVQLVSLSDPNHTDHIYPAGWVVGFSGGGTTRTGYLGTDSSGNVCAGGHSTAAHFCAVTTSAHSIDYYLPVDATGCTGSSGWPPALWGMIHPLAPTYATCPLICNGCGQAHF